MRSLLTVAAVLIVVFATRLAAPLIGPVCLAMVLAIAFEPLTTGLTRRGVPRWGAALLTTGAVLAVVIAVAAVVVHAGSELLDQLPRYGAALAAVEADAGRWLTSHGLEGVAASMAEVDAGTRVEALAEPLLWGTVDMLQTLILVVVTTAFIQIDAPGVRRGIARRLGGRDAAARVDAAVDEIQRYAIVKGLLSLANGVLLGLWCALWGVEGAVVWGIMAFALNFVPVVGSLLAAVPPVALALVLGGPSTAVGVAAGYVLVNLLVDNIIEPQVMGRAVGLSPLVVLLAMLFWGFVLGPIGALLSVPLTAIVKAGLAASPELRWLAALLEEAPPVAAARPEEAASGRLAIVRAATASLDSAGVRLFEAPVQ